MTNTPPRVSEKIETDAIEEVLDNLRHDEGCSARLGLQYRCRCNLAERIVAARAQLARLKAAAQERDAVVEECARVCDHVQKYGRRMVQDSIAWYCAKQIRALKSGVHRDESEEAGRHG